MSGDNSLTTTKVAQTDNRIYVRIGVDVGGTNTG